MFAPIQKTGDAEKKCFPFSMFRSRTNSVEFSPQITLLPYIHIIFIVMFRNGPMARSRMQDGVCVSAPCEGMGSAFQELGQFRPCSFAVPAVFTIFGLLGQNG